MYDNLWIKFGDIHVRWSRVDGFLRSENSIILIVGSQRLQFNCETTERAQEVFAKLIENSHGRIIEL